MSVSRNRGQGQLLYSLMVRTRKHREKAIQRQDRKKPIQSNSIKPNQGEQEMKGKVGGH